MRREPARAEPADEQELVARFLAAPAVAVVGASNDLQKFGARVFAALLRSGRRAFPVNPREATIQGHRAYRTLAELPQRVEAVSIITPPEVTERIVEEASRSGARTLWMQPGAESAAAVARAGELGLGVIHGGTCLLVELANERP